MTQCQGSKGHSATSDDNWQDDHGDNSQTKTTGEIGRMTMETIGNAWRQDQAATDAVEDWD